MDEQTLAWLMAGDVALRFQTARDLLGQDQPDLQQEIARSGVGAALLAARGADGHWGRGFYQPKWTSSHYTLLELRELELAQDNVAAHETVERIFQEETGPDGDLDPSPRKRASDACINGMALHYGAWFGADPELVSGVVDFLLGQRVEDGGFNCRRNRSGGCTHSSVHTTVSVLEGFTTLRDQGYTHRADELDGAVATSVEFLLAHRLFRSHRTGDVIHPEMTRLHHPTRWHYDILRGLRALAAAGVPRDPRLADAVALVAAARGSDGRWRGSAYAGVTHLRQSSEERSRWLTLSALRVLRRYPPA